MHEQKLIDASESDLGPVTAGLPFEGLCIFEQLENPIVYIPAVERPIPPKDRFKRGRRERLLENAAMSGWSHRHEPIPARSKGLAEGDQRVTLDVHGSSAFLNVRFIGCRITPKPASV